MTEEQNTAADAAAEPGTELAVVPPIDRARGVMQFDAVAERLRKLAEESARITEITSPAGYQECHAARMKLKNERVAIQRSGKDAREDATAFSKAVISVEADLVQLIKPEEERLEAIQTAEDERAQAVKRKKIEDENRRVANLQAGVAAIRQAVFVCSGQPAADILVAIETVEALALDEVEWQEFLAEATTARAETLAKLRQMLAERVNFEAEQKRLDDERAALEADRQKQESERIEREEADAARRAEEDRKAAEARRAADEAAEAERVRLREEQAEADRLASEKAAKRRGVLQNFRNIVAGARALSMSGSPEDFDPIIAGLSGLEPKAPEDELEQARLDAISELERMKQAAADRIERARVQAEEDAARAARQAELEEQEKQARERAEREAEERAKEIAKEIAERATRELQALMDEADRMTLLEAAGGALDLITEAKLDADPRALRLQFVLQREPCASGDSESDS